MNRLQSPETIKLATRAMPENYRENHKPILTPRHAVDFTNTPYSLFDPAKYEEKFKYPQREPPKYW